MVDWKRDTPWRQGHFLTDEAIDSLELRDPVYGNDTVVIVATHGCDIVQSPEIEPFVELVIGRKIDEIDGNCTHGKSARTLHMSADGIAPVFVEFVSQRKCKVKKLDLAGFDPSDELDLSPAARITFQRWLAARYRRSAFPDEFERRLVRVTNLAEMLGKAVKPHSDMISLVLFDVDEGQEIVRSTEDNVYVLDIILVHASEPDFAKAEQAANQARDIITRAFEERLLDKQTSMWKYIELRYVDVLSEDALTYRQFTLLKPWRLDFVSLGSEPQQSIAPE